jgi:acyl-CoA thioester hydrolase
MYVKRVTVGWGDMDFNAHMGNTAYLDKSADVRLSFFAENGFPIEHFMKLRLGPVVMKDEVEYFREANLLDELDIALSLAGLAEDGSRYRLRNEFARLDGTMCARVTSTGGWLSLRERKLVTPPPGLLNSLRTLPTAEDFEVLPPSIKQVSDARGL